MIRALYCWVRQLALVAWESLVVVFFMKVLGPRLVGADHPWVTGLKGNGEPIWHDNLVYRSPSSATLEDDRAIVRKVGTFLCRMVARSVPAEEIAHGPKRRMPHAVAYIHGAVHHNGAFLVFEDIPDLLAHVTDRRFRRALLRFGRLERREVTLVLRTRRVDPTAYAYCIGCLRGQLPWFSNGNGPTGKPVLWGNAAPYPVINLINGAWMADLWQLFRTGVAPTRPPAQGDAFVGPFGAGRRHFTFGDRLSAWLQYQDIRARGFKGQLVFTHRKLIEPQRVHEYREAGGWGRWVGCHEVPNPLRTLAREVEERQDSLSIIVPALNEAHRIGRCLGAARAALPSAELIVVDGGSSDDTVRVASRHGARVVVAPAGRGGQCRAGAQVAGGDVLFFLHADCIVGEGAATAIAARFADPRTRFGKLRLTYAEPGPLYAVLNRAARADHYLANTGDHGIVVRREFYDAIGGIPPLRWFEDMAFFRNARRHARLAVIDAPLYVSARRLKANGAVRQLALNTVVMTAFALGACPERLGAIYARTRREPGPNRHCTRPASVVGCTLWPGPIQTRASRPM